MSALTRGLSAEDRAAVLRCQGMLSSRATAAAFGCSHHHVLDIWRRGEAAVEDWDPDNPPFPARWRCGRCAALAEGDACVCGEHANWIKEQEYERQVTRELEAV